MLATTIPFLVTRKQLHHKLTARPATTRTLSTYSTLLTRQPAKYKGVINKYTYIYMIYIYTEVCFFHCKQLSRITGKSRVPIRSVLKLVVPTRATLSFSVSLHPSTPPRGTHLYQIYSKYPLTVQHRGCQLLILLHHRLKRKLFFNDSQQEKKYIYISSQYRSVTKRTHQPRQNNQYPSERRR